MFPKLSYCMGEPVTTLNDLEFQMENSSGVRDPDFDESSVDERVDELTASPLEVADEISLSQ